MPLLQLDSVTRKMLVPLVLASVAMLVGVLGILLQVQRQTVEAAGMATAKAVASQILHLRKFYTTEIAARAAQAGMHLDSEYASAAHTLPLPATLVKELGSGIAQEYPGMAIRLYSRHPFPNRQATETYDDFELRALDALTAAPDLPHILVERHGNQQRVRYVVADRMQSGCVDCHNLRTDSPRRDWKVGDVRGAIEVTVPVDQIAGAIDSGILNVGLAVLVGILALGSVATFATRRAAGALQTLNDELEDRVETRTADLSRANADLQEAMSHIQRSEPMAELGALIAGLAHELNTPMGNAMLVASTMTAQVDGLAAAVQGEQLRKSQLREFIDSAREACVMLQRNVSRASELVADLKQVAADQTSLRRREFSLSELVAETLRTIGPSFKHRPVSVHTEVPAELRLNSYPGALEQVVTNLVNNAVLHGQGDKAALNIYISAQMMGPTQLVLTVRDDGQGMGPQVRERAFQPFFTTRLGSGGTGLGLYLVRQLVQESLGGTVALDSTPGQGTRFEICLPLVAPEVSQAKG